MDQYEAYELQELHETGMSNKAIAERLGCNKHTVKRVLSELGLTRKKGDASKKLVALFNRGHSVQVIAIEKDLSERHVRNCLNKEGRNAPRRKPGPKSKKQLKAGK